MSSSFGILQNSVKQNIAREFEKQKVSPPDLSDIKFIAQGSFGAAVKPALPNYNETTGQWVHYPENITKIFYKKNTKNNAVKKQRTAKNMLKSNNLRINEYKYNKYTLKNLPQNVQNKVSSKIKPNTPLQLVRLPNLGNDILNYVQGVQTYNQLTDNNKNILSKIEENNKKIEKYKLMMQENNNNIMNYSEKMMRPLLNIPFSKSLYEFNKLIYNVYVIQYNRYVHGDIKIDNIMMKNDGTLTLIDYDVFDTYDNFYNFMSTKHIKPYLDPSTPPPAIEYFGAINNPPESFLFYLLNYIKSLIDSNSNINSITVDTLKSEINNRPENERNALLLRINNYIAYNSQFIFINEELFYDSLLYNLKMFIILYNNNQDKLDISTFFKYYILDKFDVFSLGIALYLAYFAYYFYMFYSESESKDFLRNKLQTTNMNKTVDYYYDLLQYIKREVIDKMILFQYDKRLTLKEAFNIFQNKFVEYKKNIQQRNNKTTKRARNNNSKNNNRAKSLKLNTEYL